MKTIILFTLLLSGYSMADQMQCEATCDNITKEQSDCVVRKRCYPEIKKLTKEKRDLQERVDSLKNELEDKDELIAVLQAQNQLEQELRDLHFGEVVDNTVKNRINFLAGDSPLGNIKGSAGKVKTERGTVVGLQYLRDECLFGLNCGVQAQTNESLFFTLGLGF